MHKFINIRRGLDLKITGNVDPSTAPVDIEALSVAITPDDFPGLTPKVLVKPGEAVAAGQPIICDKNNQQIVIVAPVAGHLAEVVRGERRKILRVIITADADNSPAPASAPASTPEDLKRAMMQSGVWAMMRQLPFDIVPDPDATVRDIFITTFDSAPLAAPMIPTVDDSLIIAAIEGLLKLTSGHIYIGVPDLGIHSGEEPASPWIAKAIAMDRVCITEFGGKHPAGLPSIQAALQAPINKGETVWLTDLDNLCRIGAVFTTGSCDWSTTVALTGSEVETPALIRTSVGAAIAPLIADRLKPADHHIRIISGNVLTGHKTAADGFLRFPYRQLTVIPEGDDVDEFMGWASLSPAKMSESRSFISKLFNRKGFNPDARLNGGRRAMIMSGLYDKVFPTDIMPEYLIKAIMARDIDRMEALGIYEVTPADFALCEYIDPSKLDLQKIVREGLDYLRKELS